MMYKIRTVIGFAVSPLVPGVLFGSFAWFGRLDISMIWFIEISAAIGYPVAVLFGIPTHVVLRNRKYTNIKYYALSGFALGVLAYLASVLLPIVMSAVAGEADLWSHFATTLSIAPVASFCGLIAGVTFWLIARPDLLTEVPIGPNPVGPSADNTSQGCQRTGR